MTLGFTLTMSLLLQLFEERPEVVSSVLFYLFLATAKVEQNTDYGHENEYCEMM